MFRRAAILAATIVTASSIALAAGPGGRFKQIDEKGKCTVKGKAKGLGEFTGEVEDVAFAEEAGKLKFTVDLDKSLKMGLRQGHTRESFKIQKGSVAILTVDKSKIAVPEDGKKLENQKVDGDLFIGRLENGKVAVDKDGKQLGMSKPVKVTYTVSRTGSDLHVKEGSSLTFNYENFGVSKICKLTICVDPSVTIVVSKPFKARIEG